MLQFEGEEVTNLPSLFDLKITKALLVGLKKTSMWELWGEHLGICIPEIEAQSFGNFGYTMFAYF